MYYIKRKSDGAYVSLEESTDTKAAGIRYWQEQPKKRLIMNLKTTITGVIISYEPKHK